MLTIDDVLDHLGIDYADEKVKRNAARALRDARSYLTSAVGEGVLADPATNHLAERLVLEYAADFYDERGTSAKAGNARRAMIESMEWQLRMERARIYNHTP